MDDIKKSSFNELRKKVQDEVGIDNKFNETMKNLADQGLMALVDNDFKVTLNKLDYAVLKLMMIDYLTNSKASA